MPTTRPVERTAGKVVERVVVPLNGSELSERALRPAFATARRAGASVHLMMVANDDPTHDVEGYLEHRAALADGPVTFGVERGAPAEVICRAADGPGSLIVMSCRGRGGIGSLLSGSLANQVLAHSGCPVVLIGPRCHATLIEGERGRVVAAVDDDADSEAVVDPAVGLSQALDLELGFVEVVPPEEAVELDDVPHCDDPTDHGRLRLAEMVRRAGAQGVPASSTVLYGAEIPTSLAHHANQVMASFLAMAVHVRTGVRRFTTESLGMETVAKAPCPVVAVRAMPPS